MKQRVIVLCVIIMTVLMILILSNGRLVKEPAVISPLIEMGVDDFRVANNRQYKARVWLAAYHGDLYFYTHNRGEKKRAMIIGCASYPKIKFIKSANWLKAAIYTLLVQLPIIYITGPMTVTRTIMINCIALILQIR